MLHTNTAPQENSTIMHTYNLNIDVEFASLIPPLTNDEFAGLEQSILAEGCREPIIIWDNTIVDGHNRYRIYKAHNIPYRTQAKEFADRNAVILWMLQNQLSRRNLNDFQRIEMVRKCEEAVKAQAEQRMLAGKDTSQHTKQISLLEEPDPVVNLSQGSKSREILGKMAGVSGSTYEHATAVLDKAPAPVVEATRKKELSINSAYEVTKLPQEQQQEVTERITQGEAPRKVVAEVKKRKQDNPQTLELPTTRLYIPEYEELATGKMELNFDIYNHTIVKAYECNTRAQNPRIDFNDGLWDNDALPIVDFMRKFSLREFTISKGGNNLVERLAEFKQLGFIVIDIISVNTQYKAPYGQEGLLTAPALLLRDIKAEENNKQILPGS